MCGIVGVWTNKSNGFGNSELEFMEQALITDSIRGFDSTGAFLILNNSQVRLSKQAASSFYFVKHPAWQDMRQKAWSQGRALIGHNRKATHGSIKSENAHPFHEGKIILVHNGTVNNHKGMKDVEVDSHAICHALNEKPAKEVLEDLKGAYALVWYNLEERTINLARNKERPLHAATTDTEVYIASEGGMLRWLLDRNNVKYAENKIIPLQEHVHFKFHLFEKKVDKKIEEIEYTPKTLPMVPSTPYMGRVHHGTRELFMDGIENDDGPLYDITPPLDEGTGLPESNTNDGVVEVLEKEQSSISKHLVEINGLERDTFVTFTVQQIKPSSMGDGCNVYGTVNAPRSKSFRAAARINIGVEDLAGLIYDHKLSAQVKDIYKVNESPVVWLKNVSALDFIKDVHGREITNVEAEYVVNKCPCAKCQGPIDRKTIEFASIKFKHGNPKRVVCATCTAKEKEVNEEKKIIHVSATPIQRGEPLGEGTIH